MKLLFVTDNGFSGVENQFFYSNANVQHYNVVTSYFDEIVFIAKNNFDGEFTNKIDKKYKTILVGNSDKATSRSKIFLEVRKSIKKEIRDADAVMCFGLNGYFAYKIAKKYGKPVIAYIGGCVYDTLSNIGSKKNKIVAPIMRKLVQEITKGANYVHYVDDYLIDRYPTQGEYIICPSVKISTDYKVLDDRIKSAMGRKKEKHILGLIGYTHNKIKGIDSAIKSLEYLDEDYKLEVVGRGDYSWLNEIIENKGLKERVEFLGVIEDRNKLIKWLDSIDIYLQPSLTEGMPRATLEAMSRGCPVIATRVGGLQTIVKEKYLIDVNSPLQLAKKIRYFEDKDIKVKNMIENFNTASNYDENILNEKREKFYDRIAKNLEETSRN